MCQGKTDSVYFCRFEIFIVVSTCHSVFISLSGSALIDKCRVIRQSLKKIVINHLSNVEILSRELKKTKGKTSQVRGHVDMA